jgi:hypothetical protein
MFRRQYPRQLGPRTPITPMARDTFERTYAHSITSSTSESSRQSGVSTEVGHGEDDGFETSQTSHLDLNDGDSVYDGDCDAAVWPSMVSPSVVSTPWKPTNPFHRQLQEKKQSSSIPWTDPSIWGSDSLI